MDVKILKVDDKKLIEAFIRIGVKSEMPSIQDNWSFNFDKHIKLPNSETYVLVKKDTPEIIEGCLIYQVLNNGTQYMSFVEIAPHNRLPSKTHDFVAGCLIAFACRLSFQLGKDYHKGWLTFDVQEELKENETKLMVMYSKKYKAVKFDGTTMLISPENGELLIEKYLNRKS